MWLLWIVGIRWSSGQFGYLSKGNKCSALGNGCYPKGESCSGWCPKCSELAQPSMDWQCSCYRAHLLVLCVTRLASWHTLIVCVLSMEGRETPHQKAKPILDAHINFVSRGINWFTLKESLGVNEYNEVLMGDEGVDWGAKVFSDISSVCLSLTHNQKGRLRLGVEWMSHKNR